MRVHKASLALATLIAALAGASTIDTASAFTREPRDGSREPSEQPIVEFDLSRQPGRPSDAFTVWDISPLKGSVRPGRNLGGRLNGGMRRTGGILSGTTTTSGGPWNRGLPRTIGISRMDRGMSGRARSPDKYYPTGQSSRTRTDIRVPMRRFRQ
jgi:hypothetical protein